MPPRRLFTIFLALTMLLAGCRTHTSPEVIPTSGAVAAPQVTIIPATTAPTSAPEATLAPTETSAPHVNVPALPDARAAQWTLVVSGLTQPTDIQNAGDERLFIVEQPGRIRIVENGRVLAAPFLDITDRVGANGSEQGLLGLAFHPNYAENGTFYVNYTDKNGDTHIAQFTASGNTADPQSEYSFITVRQPYSNHNGGALAFGPDGYLYIGLGDGGSGGDPQGNGQSLETWLGKVLRVEVHPNDLSYGVPADNPFNEIRLSEIWAYGLRNPWRFSFDALTGDFYIADVGQGDVEEVDYVQTGSPGGINFGWNIFEGSRAYKGGNLQNATMPVAEYRHSEGCSISGGYVYRGKALPAWNGVYLYGDFCSGKIWGLLKTETGWQNALLFDMDFSISTFGVDQDGELYVTDYSSGSVYRLGGE